MPQIKIPLTLDLVRPNLMIPIITKIGDANSRFIQATILNNGVAVNIPPCTVRGNFVNADGEGVYVSGRIAEDGKVEVMVPYGSFLKRGMMRCSISFVTSSPDSRLSTIHFDMFVEADEWADAGYTPEEMEGYLDQIELTVAQAFSNLVQTSGQDAGKIMSQKAVTDFVNSKIRGGTGWTTEQIDIFEDLLGDINYKTTAGPQYAAELIESLRGSTPEPTTYYTVTFNTLGHGYVAPAVVEAGTPVSRPTDPSSTGYNFAGWYTTSGFETQYTFTAPVNSDITLYAKWTPVAPTRRTVTFVMNGHGAQIEPIEVNDGGYIREPDEPHETGWLFGGWYVDSGLTTEYVFGTPVTSSFSLYASWTHSNVILVTLEKDDSYVEYDPDTMTVHPDYEYGATTIATGARNATTLQEAIAAANHGDVVRINTSGAGGTGPYPIAFDDLNITTITVDDCALDLNNSTLYLADYKYPGSMLTARGSEAIIQNGNLSGTYDNWLDDSKYNQETFFFENEKLVALEYFNYDTVRLDHLDLHNCYGYAVSPEEDNHTKYAWLESQELAENGVVYPKIDVTPTFAGFDDTLVQDGTDSSGARKLKLSISKNGDYKSARAQAFRDAISLRSYRYICAVGGCGMYRIISDKPITYKFYNTSGTVIRQVNETPRVPVEIPVGTTSVDIILYAMHANYPNGYNTSIRLGVALCNYSAQSFEVRNCTFHNNGSLGMANIPGKTYIYDCQSYDNQYPYVDTDRNAGSSTDPNKFRSTTGFFDVEDVETPFVHIERTTSDNEAKFYMDGAYESEVIDCTATNSKYVIYRGWETSVDGYDGSFGHVHDSGALPTPSQRAAWYKEMYLGDVTLRNSQGDYINPAKLHCNGQVTSYNLFPDLQYYDGFVAEVEYAPTSVAWTSEDSAPRGTIIGTGFDNTLRLDLATKATNQYTGKATDLNLNITMSSNQQYYGSMKAYGNCYGINSNTMLLPNGNTIFNSTFTIRDRKTYGVASGDANAEILSGTYKDCTFVVENMCAFAVNATNPSTKYTDVVFDGCSFTISGTEKLYNISFLNGSTITFKNGCTINGQSCANLGVDAIKAYMSSSNNVEIIIEGIPFETNTVTFNMGGHGTQVPTQTVIRGTAAIEPTDPTATGYVFGGWYTSSQYTTQYDFSSLVTQDIILYAKWTIKSYTFTFNTMGHGYDTYSVTVNHGSSVQRPSDPIDESGTYSFGGWYTTTSFETSYDFTQSVTSNKTIYAMWTTIPKYNVVFEMNGYGTQIQPQLVTEGETATEPQTPVDSTGTHTFGGWYSDSSLSTLFNFSTPIVAPITLYAKWEAVSIALIHHWKDFSDGTNVSATLEDMAGDMDLTYDSNTQHLYYGLSGDDMFGDKFTIEYEIVAPRFFSTYPEFRFTSNGTTNYSDDGADGEMLTFALSTPADSQAASFGSAGYKVTTKNQSADYWGNGTVSQNEHIIIALEVDESGKTYRIYQRDYGSTLSEAELIHEEVSDYTLQTKGFWIRKYLATADSPVYVKVYNGLLYSNNA